MSGRFSPFGRPGQPSPSPNVTDDDFSYITSEDLAKQKKDQSHSSHSQRHHDNHHHHHHHQSSGTSHHSRDRPTRDTDSLTFTHQKSSYTVHFPAYHIDDGLLTVAMAREQAARKLGVHDPRKMRMLWRGQNLKDDSRTCRDYGMRSQDGGLDIVCLLGTSSRDDAYDEGESGDESVGSGADGTSALGKLSRNQKRKERRKAAAGREPEKPSSTTSAPAPQRGQPSVEHLPVPSGNHPSHRSAPQSQNSDSSEKPPSRQPSPKPQTPMAKLDAIVANFEKTLMPPAKDFIEKPPADKGKQDYEHKRLTETILTQVLMKLDGVESEGDEEARAKRKQLVKETQEWLRRLDAAVGKHGSDLS